jgi:hypothetical protein
LMRYENVGLGSSIPMASKGEGSVKQSRLAPGKLAYLGTRPKG